MMHGDEKKGVGLIIGVGPKEEDAGGYDEELELAADDLITAMGKKDTAGVAHAFKAMHEICASREAEGD